MDEVFFFKASAFFQAALFPVAIGERRHSISACLALFTAALQSAWTRHIEKLIARGYYGVNE